MKINFELENCELLSFDENDFKLINIEEITESLFRHNNAKLTKIKIAKKINFIFKADANNIKNNITNWSKEKPFDRFLKYNDIVSISLESDKNKETIYTIWDYSFSSENNKYQRSKKNHDGSLFLEIKK